MQTSDLINFINGKKEISKKDIDELVALTKKYPYFETFYSVILRGAKKVEQDNLDSILQKFSIYIVDRKKMMNELYVEKIKIPKEVEKKSHRDEVRKKILATDDLNKKAELSKKDNDDELVFYERQKKKHKEIVREFFMDRVKKISRISELLKLEKKDNKQGDEIDPLEQKVASIRNPERQQDVKTEVVEHKKKDKVDEIKKDVEDDIFAKIAKLKKEKIDSQLDKKETEEKGGFVKEDVNKEKDSEALEELIDENEIIEEKVSEYTEENIETIDKEEIIKKDELIEKKKEVDDIVEEEKIEEKKEEKSELIESENDEDVNSGFEIVPDDERVEQNKKEIVEEEKTEKSAVDLILEKLRNRKNKTINHKKPEESRPKLSAEDVLNKLRNKPIAKTVEEKQEEVADLKFDEPEKEEEKIELVEEKQEEVADLKSDELEKEEEKQEEVADLKSDELEKEEEKIELVEEKQQEEVADLKSDELEKEEEKIELVEEKQEEVVDLKSDELEKDATPKTAADRILERIQIRKKTSQKDIINQFLVKKPSVDGKKEPENKDDLAKDSVKDVEVATERLAEIYCLQGLNDKAIEIYDKLILKNPEKKAYFAQKIDELKN